MSRTHLLAGSLILSLIFIAGCNKDEKPAINGKAAAVVNGQTITDETIQAEAKKLGVLPTEMVQKVGNQILKTAIDQELLAQEAVKSKLSESPEVQLKLAAARRAILAQAELASLTAGVEAPTTEQVKAYFDAHPELFSQRKAFRLVDLVIDTTPENIEKVRALIAKSKDINELVKALKDQGIAVNGQQMQKTAEELPKELLSKLAVMKNGQTVSFDRAGKVNIMLLQDAREMPVTLEQATPVINGYLINEVKGKKIDEALNKIRAQSKIEYVAPYSAPETDKK